MKTYQVQITETAVYVISVEAESPEDAEREAEEIFVQSEYINDFFSHVEGRTAEAVTASD